MGSSQLFHSTPPWGPCSTRPSAIIQEKIAQDTHTHTHTHTYHTHTRTHCHTHTHTHKHTHTNTKHTHTHTHDAESFETERFHMLSVRTLFVIEYNKHTNTLRSDNVVAVVGVRVQVVCRGCPQTDQVTTYLLFICNSQA